MDAFVQLALIEKAKRVFSMEPDIELCFPLLSPLSFTAQELSMLATPQSAADYAAAADFACIVNFVPHGLVANASELMLWDVYRNVLDRADVASGSQDNPVDAAGADLLYDTAADGSRVESQALKRYRQYRDAWFAARENYGQHKSTGEASDDPAVRRQWAEVDEPGLRAAIDAAAADWETLGQRTQIEQAIAAQRMAALNAPAARWSEWQNDFNPDIDMVTGAGGNRYAPTGIAPRDFASQGEWLGFELSAAEMHALVTAAPDALKVILDDDAGGNLQHVAFEYRSVALVRPWFHPEALISRIWRSTDPDLSLSDGADPPHGSCPAYAAACVFVRRVVVTEKGASAPQPQRELRFTLDAKLLAHQELKINPLILKSLQLRRDPAATRTVVPPALSAQRLFRGLVAQSFTVAAPPAHSTISRAVGRAMTLPAAPVVRDHRVRVDPDRLVRVPLRNLTVAPYPAPTPAPASAPASQAEADELSILAFICKRLPRTPDPAAGLTWA